MTDPALGHDVHLPGATPAEARERVTRALAAEGFGVLTEIDVAATLRAKLDVDFRPYVILGACNPQLAHRALTTDPGVGLLLPCNVVVEAAPDGASVSIASPRAMFALVGGTALEPLVAEAEARIARVAAALRSGTGGD